MIIAVLPKVKEGDGGWRKLYYSNTQNFACIYKVCKAEAKKIKNKKKTKIGLQSS